MTVFKTIASTLCLASAVATSAAVTGAGAAQASTSPTSAVAGVQSSSKYPQEPAQKVKALKADGYVRISTQSQLGTPVEIYRKEIKPGIYAEDTVLRTDLRATSQPVPQWKAGWDNGPRLYMTGSEFWSHSAATVAGIVCSVVATPIGGFICAAGADAAWSGVAPHIAKDETCYDLSQFMNKGWEKVSSDKC